VGSIYVSVSDIDTELDLHHTTSIVHTTSIIIEIPRMRSPIETSTSQASLRIQSNVTVLPKASLTITITTRTKSKRRMKKDRPVERPDGVITEHPRYQPAGSSFKPDLRFEKKLFPLEEVLRSSKQDQPSKLAVEDIRSKHRTESNLRWPKGNHTKA
jgi:hypothetical protein